MPKITTFLTFNNQAEEAVNLYTSVFQNSKIIKTSYFGKGAPAPAGSVMTIVFQLNGQEYIAMNGGDYFKFAEGISLLVLCTNQEEIDNLWEKLSEGGQQGPCGWLKDKFGVSWQIVPTELDTMLQDKDPEKAKRVMHAMLKMKKIDMKALEDARTGILA